MICKGCVTNCTYEQNNQCTVHILFIQFLVCLCMFQLLIWHFFVLTQKSTHAKGIPLGKKSQDKKMLPPAPIAIGALPPFCRASALEFQDQYSLRDLVHDDRLLFFNPVQFVMHPFVSLAILIS